MLFRSFSFFGGGGEGGGSGGVRGGCGYISKNVKRS